METPGNSMLLAVAEEHTMAQMVEKEPATDGQEDDHRRIKIMAEEPQIRTFCTYLPNLHTSDILETAEMVETPGIPEVTEVTHPEWWEPLTGLAETAAICGQQLEALVMLAS